MTVLDKSVPYYPVLMVLHEHVIIKNIKLPSGYHFKQYDVSYKEAWIALHVALGQLESIAYGRTYFEETFEAYPAELKKQMILIVNEEEKLVGTSSIWRGNHFGEDRLRVHWVGVHPEHQKKGLAKALMLRTIQLYDDMSQSEPLYLTTQTNSYVAIGMYLRLGFEPYMGLRPVNFHAKEETFIQDNEKAWEIIYQKLDELKKI